MTIVLADPNAAMRLIQKKVLDDMGLHKMAGVSTGKEVLAIIKNPCRLLVIADKFKDSTGINLLAHIRKIAPDLPVVMCSANTSAGHIAASVKGHVTNFIVKPFQADVFKDKIQQTLDATAGISSDADLPSDDELPPAAE